MVYLMIMMMDAKVKMEIGIVLAANYLLMSVNTMNALQDGWQGPFRIRGMYGW